MGFVHSFEYQNKLRQKSLYLKKGALRRAELAVRGLRKAIPPSPWGQGENSGHLWQQAVEILLKGPSTV